MEQIYVIKVRSAPPPPSEFLPSERRYSAHGVLGLASVHLIITGLLIILAIMRAHATGYYFWPLTFVIVTSSVAGVIGLLAWHRWYQSVFIRSFLIAASVSCCTGASVAIADILTAVGSLGAAEFHAVLACIFEAVWSAVSGVVAWRGVRNKSAGEDIISSSVTSPLRHAWPVLHEDAIKKESQAKVLEYLRNGSRPPVEGKEKSVDDNNVISDAI